MELDNKHIMRILIAAGGLVFALYWIRVIGSERPATEENPLLVSGAALFGGNYRPGGKKFPASTDVYWCGAQNEDLGMSLTAAQYWRDCPESHFPLRRGLI